MSEFGKPLVSVLIPAFNHEKYIEETVLSVVNQTYGFENIQLIIVDDFSHDNTREILKRLAKIYEFELVLHKKNVGLPLSLNEMISMSKGKYVTSIASDDIMLLDRIENQVNILINFPEIDFLAGDSILINENGEQICVYNPRKKLILTKYYFEDFFLTSKKPGFAAGTIILRSELIKRIGVYDADYKIEDFYYQLKASYHKANIVKCNLPFIYYRLHSKSISSNIELITEEIFRTLSIYKNHPKYYKAIQNREISSLSKYAFTNKLEILNQLLHKPSLLCNKLIFRLLLMTVLPSSILKKKYPQKYFRYITLN